MFNNKRDIFKQDKENIEITETKTSRKVSIDRPTEPTFPWRKPSEDAEVLHLSFKNKYFVELYDRIDSIIITFLNRTK